MTAIVAAIAGADPARILLLAFSMLCLQLAIGAINDWADAPADATAQPNKPIPAGLVPRPAAVLVGCLAALAGLSLAAIAGLGALVVAAAGLATGLVYDLRLKGTRWSWVPYAVGIPLLPVFAWVGATGTVPAAFAVLVPVAMLAGAALAVANAVADLERDAGAGVDTVATSLGLTAARRVGAALEGAVAVAALISALALGGSGAWLAVGAVGAAIVAGGVALGWQPGARARQRAWEIQAIGIGLLAAGWVGALAAAGRMTG